MIGDYCIGRSISPFNYGNVIVVLIGFFLKKNLSDTSILTCSSVNVASTFTVHCYAENATLTNLSQLS